MEESGRDAFFVGDDGNAEEGFEDWEADEAEEEGYDVEADEPDEPEETNETDEPDETDETDEPDETEADEATEPFEWEGRHYAVPEALMPALSVAKEVETQRQDVLQAQEQLQRSLSDAGDYLKQVGWSMVLEDRLKAYHELDWNAYHRKDPDQARADRWEYDQLRDEQRQLNETINQRTAEREAAHAQGVAEQLQAGAQALKQAIPNWSPEQGVAIRRFACEQYGYQPHELSRVTDHRFVQALRDAKLYREQAGRAVRKKAEALVKAGPSGQRKARSSVKGKPRVEGRYRPLKSAQGRGVRKPAAAAQSTGDWIKEREAYLQTKEKRARRQGAY